MSKLSPHLSERYGVKNSRATRRLKIISLSFLSLVFLSLVLWVGYVFAFNQQITTNTIGYDHLSDSKIRITFSVNMPPGTEANCSLIALNENRGQAGVVEYHIPAQTEQLTFHQVEIEVQQKAVGANVGQCVVVN